MHLTQHMSGRLIAVLRRLKPRTRDAQVAALVTAALVLMTVPQAFADLPSAGLDPGFRRPYHLDFRGGEKKIDPVGEGNHKTPPGAPEGSGAPLLYPLIPLP